MNPAQLYQEAIKPIKTKQEELDLNIERESKQAFRERWLRDPLTIELIKFLEQRRFVLNQRALETAAQADKLESLIPTTKNAAKTLTYDEVINYVKTGTNPV